MLTSEEVIAWRAQIDLVSERDELVRIIKAIRNIDPALFILAEAAQNKLEKLHAGVFTTMKFPKVQQY